MKALVRPRPRHGGATRACSQAAPLPDAALARRRRGRLGRRRRDRRRPGARRAPRRRTRRPRAGRCATTSSSARPSRSTRPSASPTREPARRRRAQRHRRHRVRRRRRRQQPSPRSDAAPEHPRPRAGPADRAGRRVAPLVAAGRGRHASRSPLGGERDGVLHADRSHRHRAQHRRRQIYRRRLPARPTSTWAAPSSSRPAP